MISARDFAASLRSHELEDAWQRCSEDLEGFSVREREEIQTTVTRLRDQFMDVLRDVTDPGEHEALTAVFYTLVRSQWILSNVQSGYQIAAGRIDRRVHCRSGMLSALLGRLEKVLDPADVSAIVRLLAQPVHAAATPRIDVPGAEGNDTWPVPDEAMGAEAVRLAAEVDSLRRLMRDLQAERADLEAEAIAAREARALLQAEVGTGDATAVVRHIRDLQERLNALEELQAVLGGLDRTDQLINF